MRDVVLIVYNADKEPMNMMKHNTHTLSNANKILDMM